MPVVASAASASPAAAPAARTRQPASGRRGSGAATAPSGGVAPPQPACTANSAEASRSATFARSRKRDSVAASSAAWSRAQSSSRRRPSDEDEEIRQPLALRRQQRGPDGPARRGQRRHRWRRGPGGRRRGPRPSPPPRPGPGRRAIGMREKVGGRPPAMQQPRGGARRAPMLCAPRPMRILFVTATRIGDAVLSTALLGHLLRAHPGARVTVACGPCRGRRLRAHAAAGAPDRGGEAAAARCTGRCSGRRSPSRAGTWWWTCAPPRSPGWCRRGGARIGKGGRRPGHRLAHLGGGAAAFARRRCRSPGPRRRTRPAPRRCCPAGPGWCSARPRTGPARSGRRSASSRWRAP